MYKFLILLTLPYLVQTQWIDLPERKEYIKQANPEIQITSIEIESGELTGGSILFKFKF